MTAAPDPGRMGETSATAADPSAPALEVVGLTKRFSRGGAPAVNAKAKAAMYTMGGYEADANAFDYSPFGSGSGQAVPLEDFDYGPFRT